jgi:hypothetical protein
MHSICNIGVNNAFMNGKCAIVVVVKENLNSALAMHKIFIYLIHFIIQSTIYKLSKEISFPILHLSVAGDSSEKTPLKLETKH